MHAELLQDMINLLAYAISSRGSTVEELLDMLNYEFSNDSMYPTGDDPVSEYPEEVKSAFGSANDGVMYDDYLRYLSGSVQRSSLDNQMENTMRTTIPKLRRVLRKIILEFGESDAEVIRQSQNREKMIGRGIDMGTIGFDPNHDYDKRPSSTKPKFRASDVLAQVGHVMEDLANSDAMMEHFEWKPSRNPDVAHIVSGGMTVVVKNNYGEFTFKMQKPHAWLGWERTCDSVDSQIEDILYDLQDYIDEKENG